MYRYISEAYPLLELVESQWHQLTYISVVKIHGPSIACALLALHRISCIERYEHNNDFKPADKPIQKVFRLASSSITVLADDSTVGGLLLNC